MKIKLSFWQISSLVLFVLCIVLFSLRGCGINGGETKTVFTTDTTYIPGDPYPVTKTLTIEKPVTVETVRWRDRDVDTNKILEDYFTKYAYHKVLQDDSSALITISDTISENRIVGRSFNFQNRRRTSVIINNTTTTITQKQPLFRLGLGLTGMYSMKDKSFDIGPGASLHTRPGFYAGYSYLISGKSHQVSAGWIISFKSKK